MNQTIRQPLLVNLPSQSGADGRSAVRAQNFTIERIVGETGRACPFASQTEIIILLPTTGAKLAGDQVADLPGQGIAILPAGRYSLENADGEVVYILATDRIDPELAVEPVTAGAYQVADQRVRAVGLPYRRIAHRGEVRVHLVKGITIPPDNGRLRFLQSETMSLNWVEYDGIRDRNSLSPHAHDDAEQASLAIKGDFVHHLRTPWGRDANLWREDQHLLAAPNSVIVIPPQIVHTTEGSGEGMHVLVDVFAPPRKDFIAKNWVFNAGEYVAPAEDQA